MTRKVELTGVRQYLCVSSNWHENLVNMMLNISFYAESVVHDDTPASEKQIEYVLVVICPRTSGDRKQGEKLCYHCQKVIYWKEVVYI